MEINSIDMHNVEINACWVGMVSWDNLTRMELISTVIQNQKYTTWFLTHSNGVSSSGTEI